MAVRNYKVGKKRMAGVLMPVASLPSKEGIGSFGKEAYKFVDIIADMGIRVWQILPLNPLGFGNSPYQPFSSFAGDELYIDLGLLAEEGLIGKKRDAFVYADKNRIDYEAARAYKTPFLREAFNNFRKTSEGDRKFRKFRATDWVYPYAVFISLKRQNGMRCWNEWPKEQQDWILDQKYDISHLENEIEYEIFIQYMFFKQWMALKEYANRSGIQIMGDVPFYVGIDSLDVWSSREDFLLDDQWQPTHVAGVPPDYFSTTGQRWGNPIYNWDKLEKDGFTFWINRLSYSSKLYDIIRIDHFRAFDTYWKINASCPTAIDGEWLEAPGTELFEEIYEKMPDIQIVAEDLGDLRPQVLELRDAFGLMGMNVAEFTIFTTTETQKNQVIYTGTHDNQTVKSWYADLDKDTKAKIRKSLYEYSQPGESISNKMLRFIFGSECMLAIAPVADILGLDDIARLNFPGTVGSPNWEWRLDDYGKLLRRREWMRELVEESRR